MGIDKVTIGDVKSLLAMLGQCAPQTPQPHPFEGRYCVFRAYKIGVCVGTLERVVMAGRESQYLVRGCRRVQYQDYNGFTLTSVPTMGLGAETKMSPPADETLQASDVCEVLLCTEEVTRMIKEMPDATA